MPILVNPDNTEDIEVSDDEFQDASEHMDDEDISIDVFLSQEVPSRLNPCARRLFFRSGTFFRIRNFTLSIRFLIRS
jgi:hypothetical protein